MKILHVIAPNGLAGAERVVLGGVAALRDAGHDARLVILDEVRAPGASVPLQDAARAVGLFVVVIPVRSRLDRQAARALAEVTDDADVLHLHGHKALTLARRPRHGVWLATHHGDTSHDLKARVYEALTRLLYRRLDGVVAVSSQIRDSLHLRNSCVIENFLTVRAVPTLPPSNATPQLLVLGRLSPEKGVDVLLRALAADAMPSIGLQIVGDGPEQQALQQLARELGVPVAFHGFQSDVLPHLAAADAVCMPSRREGLPLAALEALCAGRPLLASAVGALPELVALGAGGTVAPDDPTALAVLLRRWHADRATWAQQALERADAIRSRFSPQVWASQTLACYQQCMTRAPSPSFVEA